MFMSWLAVLHSRSSAGRVNVHHWILEECLHMTNFNSKAGSSVGCIWSLVKWHFAKSPFHSVNHGRQVLKALILIKAAVCGIKWRFGVAVTCNLSAPLFWISRGKRDLKATVTFKSPVRFGVWRGGCSGFHHWGTGTLKSEQSWWLTAARLINEAIHTHTHTLFGTT